MSSIKNIAIAALSIAAAAGMAASAEAKGGGGGGGHHGHHHHHHFRSFSYIAPVVVTPSCNFYWRRYMATGNVEWKRRYYQCID